MDWITYKRICDEPGVVSRWLLEQTAELLAEDEELRTAVLATLGSAPLAKPSDHHGGPQTDMFRLGLARDAVLRVCDRVESAAAVGVETSGTRGRGLGGFAEAWRECADAL